MQLDLGYEELTSSHPFVTTVATWIQEEWGAEKGHPFPETLARLVQQENCPPSQIARTDSAPLGVVGFYRYPLTGVPEPQLWIDVLYVAKAYRRRGIATELVRLAERLASAHTRRLYVYTSVPVFYLRLNWVLMSGPDEAGSSVLERELPEKN